MKRITTLILTLSAAAAAQTAVEVRVGMAMQPNAEALRQYGYKRRMENDFQGRPRGRKWT